MSDEKTPTHKMGVPLLPVVNPKAVVTTEMVSKLIEEADNEDLERAIRMATGRKEDRPDKSSE